MELRQQDKDDSHGSEQLNQKISTIKGKLFTFIVQSAQRNRKFFEEIDSKALTKAGSLLITFE